MSFQQRVEPHHKLAYGDNVAMVAQQKKNKLRATVTEVACTGEAHSAADLMGIVEAQERTSTDRRNPDNPPDRSRRWLIFPDPVESGQYIDKAEKFMTINDPTSQLVKAHTMGVDRVIGDKILGVRYISKGNFEFRDGGILGDAVEGKRPGGNKSSLPASCYTAAGGTGLTLPKLIGSKERLNSDDFGLEDDDEMYCAISPKQVTNLLSIADGDGASLNAFQQMQLASGKPTSLMGYTWIVTNRLPVDSENNRLCPLWTKGNIALGIWQDIKGDMWNDGNRQNLPYAFVDAYIDCVRIQDLGVHVIRCAES